jgi:hypothetical protein
LLPDLTRSIPALLPHKGQYGGATALPALLPHRGQYGGAAAASAVDLMIDQVTDQASERPCVKFKTSHNDKWNPRAGNSGRRSGPRIMRRYW